MKRALVLALLAALVGCTRVEPSATSPPTPGLPPSTSSPSTPAGLGSTSAAAPPDATLPTAVANRGGLRGLLAALNDVETIELRRWNPPAPPDPLSASDRAQLLKLLQRSRLIEESTVAHPPWPAAFVFHTRSHGSYAATLVGRSNLRLDSGRSDGRFEPTAGVPSDARPPEMWVEDELGWLWQYLESRLGVTKQKEYSAPKQAPDYLELPSPPKR
ncbi:MAG: hypothetical protein K0R38_2318 [Polyangiaceae bacterium]|jgi:hypothetical protein|nr:hypothetical protein [Polyangiaceae bacterium]